MSLFGLLVSDLVFLDKLETHFCPSLAELKKNIAQLGDEGLLEPVKGLPVSITQTYC